MNELQAVASPQRAGSTSSRRRLLAVAIAQAVAASPGWAATITVDDFGDVSGANCTLRDAVASANTDAAVAGCRAGRGDDLIQFTTTAAPFTITIQPAQIQISSPLTIQGPGADLLTISGNNASRIFSINDGSPSTSTGVTISALTLTGGVTSGDGGAVENFETLEIRDSTLTGNSAMSGGAVANSFATVALVNSELSFNTALMNGGALNNSGTMTIDDVTIDGNTANYGGGVYNTSQGTATITGGSIDQNTAVYGGGIASSGDVTVTGSTISGNSASSRGGGIGNRFSGVATITATTIDGNTADQSGGGLYSSSAGTATLTGGAISANTAAIGGGLYIRGASTVTGSTISGNSAANGGGVGNFGTVSLSNSRLVFNTASQNGGGIVNGATATIAGSTISGNSAANNGGGLHSEFVLSMKDSTTSGNTAGEEGGGLWLSSPNSNYSITVTNSTISGNTAAQLGGGIYADEGAFTVTHSTISGNSAYSGAGLNAGLAAPSLINTIIADSRGGGDCSSPTPDPNVNNLIENGDCDPEFSGDPMLGPLADNGGPTETHRPMRGSPAIDAADGASCPGADQRGFQSPVDGDNDGNADCDIGAVEFKANPEIFKSGFETIQNP